MFIVRCGEFTKHQTIDSVDLYKKDLETKDTLEMSGKDRICKKLLKIK